MGGSIESLLETNRSVIYINRGNYGGSLSDVPPVESLLTLGVTGLEVERRDDAAQETFDRVSSVHRVKLGDMVNVPCLSCARNCSLLPQHALRGDPGGFWNPYRSTRVAHRCCSGVYGVRKCSHAALPVRIWGGTVDVRSGGPKCNEIVILEISKTSSVRRAPLVDVVECFNESYEDILRAGKCQWAIIYRIFYQKILQKR